MGGRSGRNIKLRHLEEVLNFPKLDEQLEALTRECVDIGSRFQRLAQASEKTRAVIRQAWTATHRDG